MAECFWTDLVGVTQGLCGEDAGGDLFALVYFDRWNGPSQRELYVVNKSTVPVALEDRDTPATYALTLTRAKVTEAVFYEHTSPDFGCGLELYDIHEGLFSSIDPYFYSYFPTHPDLTSTSLASPVTTTGLDIDLVYTLNGDGEPAWALLDSDYTPGYGLTKLTVDTDIGVFDWWICVYNCI